MNAHLNRIDSLQVRRNFIRCIQQPASLAAFVAREIGKRMMERLACIKLNPQHFLDISVMGDETYRLIQMHYPKAQAVLLENCLPLLHRKCSGQKRYQSFLSKWVSRTRLFKSYATSPLCVCAEMTQLPVKDRCVELIWSNLALHWHSDPSSVIQEWQRVLAPQSLLMFSCFGPDTFKELRSIFAQDTDRRLLTFIDMHDIGDQLIQHGFVDPVMDMEQITLTYTSPEQLLKEVSSLGGNSLRHRSRGLLSRQRYRFWLEALQANADTAGRIPLTLEIVYGHAWKGMPKQQRTPEGYATIPLSQLLTQPNNKNSL